MIAWRRAVWLLVAGLVVAGPAFAWSESKYRAEIIAPRVVNLATTPEFPIVVKVTGPDGTPFTGDVELWSDYGGFVTSEGKLANGPYPAHVFQGKVEARYSFGGQTYAVTPFTLSVTRSGEEVLGKVAVHVRYPAEIEFLPEQTTLFVRADGQRRPLIGARLLDQFHEPLENAEVCGRFYNEKNEEQFVTARTDAAGEVHLTLPASDRPWRGVCQLHAAGVAAPGLIFSYTEGEPEMVPFEEAAKGVGLTPSFDSTGRTGIYHGRDGDVIVRAGRSAALIGGRTVPMGLPARLHQGRLEIPAAFAKWSLW